jgi:hypothetical protein
VFSFLVIIALRHYRPKVEKNSKSFVTIQGGTVESEKSGQKHSEDRKMADRKMIRKRIKFVMIPHAECLPPARCAKMSIAVMIQNTIFLSVIFPSWFLFKPIVLPQIVLPFEMA